MKQDLAVFKQQPLNLWIPETKDELERGYSLKELKEGEGMLFIPSLVNSEFRDCYIPIKLGGNARFLDVVWLFGGGVVAYATLYGGIILGYGNSVLELPPSWCLRNKVTLGDQLVMDNGTQEKTV